MRKIVPRLTKKKAQDLIKRELGISATALEKPPLMNGNPESPWFQLYIGNIRITVYDKVSAKVGYVVLTVHFENSGHSTVEYFYADTLEYADEATRQYAAEDLCEMASAYVTSDTVFDPLLRQTGKALREANARHFGA